MRAIELIEAFNKFVLTDPTNKHRTYLSFTKKDKFLEVLGELEWDEVESRQEILNKKMRELGKKPLSEATLKLAWKGLAYCYEYSVQKRIIPINPFKDLLPKKPKSGSLFE